MAISGQVFTLSLNTSDPTKYDISNAGSVVATAIADGGSLKANVLAALRTAGATATTYVHVMSISDNPLYLGLVG